MGLGALGGIAARKRNLDFSVLFISPVLRASHSPWRMQFQFVVRVPEDPPILKPLDFRSGSAIATERGSPTPRDVAEAPNCWLTDAGLLDCAKDCIHINSTSRRSTAFSLPWLILEHSWPPRRAHIVGTKRSRYLFHEAPSDILADDKQESDPKESRKAPVARPVSTSD